MRRPEHSVEPSLPQEQPTAAKTLPRSEPDGTSGVPPEKHSAGPEVTSDNADEKESLDSEEVTPCDSEQPVSIVVPDLSETQPEQGASLPSPPTPATASTKPSAAVSSAQSFELTGEKLDDFWREQFGELGDFEVASAQVNEASVAEVAELMVSLRHRQCKTEPAFSKPESTHEASEGRIKPKQRICFAFRDTGSCRRGDACKFHHVQGGGQPRPQPTKVKDSNDAPIFQEDETFERNAPAWVK